MLPLGGLAFLTGRPAKRVSPAPAAPSETSAAAIPATDPPAPSAPLPGELDPQVLAKIRDYDRTFPDDYFLPAESMATLAAVEKRVRRVRDLVGFGHFNLLSFDDMLRYAGNFSEVGAFPAAELALLDRLFHENAARYGFYGEKILTEISAVIAFRDVVKISGSGHYLFRGEALEKFTRIRNDVGHSLMLTSGVRGIAKQFQLFLTKVVATKGNLSQASRSLAPPGYSYHARGDFDVGKMGFGLKNFDESFCETDEFRGLMRLGYVSIRYPEVNPFGVRHEPWHIKVA